ncbi:MAG: rRNA maturation RNase YbeY [Bacteroidales bacterium]|nr:rRNA maturation RNase YbeY [Bacteroidales bacterium]
MITYNAYSEAMPELDTTATTAWIARVAEKHGKRIGNVNYIFCTDDEILDVNRQYLRHDYYTDIITFDYCAHGILSGDIYISLDTVASNAEGLEKDPDEELHRVLIHGILHLVGINDKGPGEREIMEHAEDEALAMR